MPIRVIAIAELVVAIALMVRRVVAGDADGPEVTATLMLGCATVLNAVFVFLAARSWRGPANMFGFAFAALGGGALLLIGSFDLWRDAVLGEPTSWAGIVSQFGLTMRILDALFWVAVASLLAGWAVPLLSRIRSSGRRPRGSGRNPPDRA
ncbi:hypothetical protein ACG3SL_02515 [Sphingomonas sp. CJ20]